MCSMMSWSLSMPSALNKMKRGMLSGNIRIFFISQDKKNVYAPGELSKVKEHLKFKNDLYYVLNKKTEDYLFYGEDNNVNEFISIYQSLIRLQYDLLNSVSKNVRQNFLLK